LIGLIPGSGTKSNYDPRYFEHLFQIEDKHFWFKTRNRAIAILISQITQSLMPGYKVLEVGCGTGNLLQVLEHNCIHGKVFGMDLLYEGLQYARQRMSSLLVQCDINNPSFKLPFNIVGLFDVLEHSDNDRKLLSNLYDMLTENGVLILTVPAHHYLWSYFDECSLHRRRYSLTELKNKLNDVGFHVEYLTEYMASIFPLVWLKRKLGMLFFRKHLSIDDKHTLVRSEMKYKPIINEFLSFLLSIEVRLISRRYTLPIGTSLLAIARKNTYSIQFN
jgi:SAM-dependent methyltransferase